jgi:hypothetical protein
MLNKHDRARIGRVSQKIDEYYRRAEQTDDLVKRERYLVLAKRGEKSRKMQRTFPGSFVLWGMAGILILIPWSLLSHAGIENWGFVGSFVVFGFLVTLKLWLRSRHE